MGRPCWEGDGSFPRMHGSHSTLGVAGSGTRGSPASCPPHVGTLVSPLPSSASTGPHCCSFSPLSSLLSPGGLGLGGPERSWSSALPSAPHSRALLQHLPCFRGRGGSRAGCDPPPPRCLSLGMLSLTSPNHPPKGHNVGGGKLFPVLEGFAPLQAGWDPKGSTQEGSG